MILITGSAGYIGSHICCYLDKKKINYIGIDNLSYSYSKNITNKKKFARVDISNLKELKKIISKNKIKTVIHAAAFSYVVEGEILKKKYYTNNIVKTKKFIDCCKNNNIENFIFLSSSNVYKEKKNNSAYKENNFLKPKNFYGKNKLIIEKYLNKKFNKKIILRLFNVIGIFNKNFIIFKFKKNNYQRLIFKLIQNIQLNKSTNINFFKINNKVVYPARDFVDVKDVVKIIEKMLYMIRSKKKISEIINVGSGKSIHINKIVNLLNKVRSNRCNINLKEISKKELFYTRSNITKLSKIIGKKPKLNLNSIIKSHFKKL
ncbi:NAD-dependent epimerase/dehydratase family protein [Candidatus Pelagibacter communis]|uniref:NAD-dependent epimerase/dehydratase family protein n=1 Tax=Candidatus Pelagibacter TaxID=198251 RepID=UPI003EE13E60